MVIHAIYSRRARRERRATIGLAMNPAPPPQPAPRPESGRTPAPILALESLTRRFGGLTAVDRCSFAIEAGRITGMIGPNGAGKTTIFSMVAGALPPSAGRILFDGEDITGLPTHRLFHRGIVRTFQIPHEFGRLTVLENLMAVPAAQPGERLWPVWLKPGAVTRREREVRERAEDALRFLTLWELRDELAMNLSGGQKKLLELGRAMMTSPRLVLLDEPGAGVNPTLLVCLREMILELNRERGYTFVVIEHDMDFIAFLCERVIVLSQGAVLTDGPMEQVRRDPRVLDAYLGGGEEGEGAEPRSAVGGGEGRGAGGTGGDESRVGPEPVAAADEGSGDPPGLDTGSGSVDEGEEGRVASRTGADGGGGRP